MRMDALIVATPNKEDSSCLAHSLPHPTKCGRASASSNAVCVLVLDLEIGIRGQLRGRHLLAPRLSLGILQRSLSLGVMI